MELMVTIAIPDIAGPVALARTLASLARHTEEPYEIVLFAENGQASQFYQGEKQVRSIETSIPFSAPVALNQLLATGSTPYILLLECGSIVTAHWLTGLLEPFQDLRVGLSGPSTNICWNEQQVLEYSHGKRWSTAQIDVHAQSIASRYANQHHSLDILHNLGDFCYLFRRSLAEELGGFDETYGGDPCWEIDFSTRAARVGYRAIWVASAYVHRAPISFIDASKSTLIRGKQRYQDHFCGLRLQGQKATYEDHCRGEVCEYFAPLQHIHLRLEALQNVRTVQAPQSMKHSFHETVQSEQPSTAPTLQLPLVSCIMPTYNRSIFVRQALNYFERQDYPNKELIIVDDGDKQVADIVRDHPNVRYIALSQKRSIGAKRNIACEIASGAIIMHWDDDDWYAPHRISHQVVPLLRGESDLNGLETFCFFELLHLQGWTCSKELHRSLFVGDVHGGTLAYWRWVWERHARYPNTSLAEDAHFLQQACQRGVRLCKLPHARSFVYLRHESNAWQFPLGAYLSPLEWQRIDLDTCMPAEDLAFYQNSRHLLLGLKKDKTAVLRQEER